MVHEMAMFAVISFKFWEQCNKVTWTKAVQVKYFVFDFLRRIRTVVGTRNRRSDLNSFANFEGAAGGKLQGARSKVQPRRLSGFRRTKSQAPSGGRDGSG